MNVMLAKILEMDKTSRKQAEEAEESKKKAFDELASIRTSLIEKSLAAAQKTVAELKVKELNEAAKTTAVLKTQNEAAKAKLTAAYTENGKKWIDDIYRRVLE